MDITSINYFTYLQTFLGNVNLRYFWNDFISLFNVPLILYIISFIVIYKVISIVYSLMSIKL